VICQSDQLGRDGRKTLRVGERHWQPYGHGSCGQAQADVIGRGSGLARRMESRSLLAVAGAAFAAVMGGAAAGFTSGLAASAVTTAAPMASAIEPAASLEADI
jgi:anti-sigma factor RsiW